MKYILAYAIVFGNIVAILVMTLIQPQSVAMHKKKIWDTRIWLLAQMQPAQIQPAQIQPESGSGSSGGGTPAIYYLENIILQPGETKYLPSAIGLRIQQEGINQEIIYAVARLDRVAKALYVNIYGHPDFINGNVKKAVDEAFKIALNNASKFLRSDESLNAWWARAGALYFSQVQVAFEAIRTVAYFSSPTPFLLGGTFIDLLTGFKTEHPGLMKTIEGILKGFMPVDQVVETPKEEKIDDTTPVVQEIAETEPTPPPAVVLVPEEPPRENIAQLIIQFIKQRLGLEIRKEGIKRIKRNRTPKEEEVNKKRRQLTRKSLIETFRQAWVKASSK